MFFYGVDVIMRKQVAILFALVVSFTFQTQAALISVERYDLDGTNPGDDLAGFWNTVSPYTVDVIDTATLIYNGSAHNQTLFKMTVDLSSLTDRTVSLYAGFDAGYGAEAFLNGVQIANEDRNLWWGRNWDHNHVMDLADLDIASGQNTLEIFWAENRNSGGNSFRISEQRLGVQELSTAAVRAAVPEPSTIALMLLAMVGLVYSRQRS